MKALTYLRVSGLGQVDGDGLPRQRDAVVRYAKKAGVEIVGEYRDEAVSGTKDLEDRPGLAALLDRLESNGVRAVLVERADRLARDLIVSETILGQLRTRGVKVFDAEGVELTVGDGDPTRKLIRQVLGAVSEFDRCVTVLKLRAARERIRRAGGRCEGRKPYGTLPAEVPVLERILAMRRAKRGQPRLSFGKIADQLNANGIPTRSGKSWSPATIFKIVREHSAELAKRKVA